MVDEEEKPPESDTDQSFASLLDASAPRPERLEPGQAIQARIIALGGEWLFLDIGGKGEGILDRREVADETGRPAVKAGDVLRVYFIGSDEDGLKFTTRLGSGPAAQAMLEDAFRNGIPLEGQVGAEVKGGFEVRLGDGIRAFCPFSQMAMRRADKPTDQIGQRLPFIIAEYGEGGRNIVLSHRAVLEEEARKAREALKARLKEGMTVRGIVTGVRDFGVFVNLGPLEGLVPLSEVGWSRSDNVREMFAPGQEVTLIVKALDWERDRITLSLKDTLPDPWLETAGRFPAGSVHTGRVTRLAAFGAFVSLAEGVEGLVHISKLGGGKRIKHPREVVREGQTMVVKVGEVDMARKRISLAPADFGETEEGGRTLKEFKQKTEASGSMGTLGDLLKARLEEKKKG